jgi:hypothetical protein
MVQNNNFFGEQTLNEETYIRPIENLTCLILVPLSRLFSTEKNKQDTRFDQNKQTKKCMLHSIKRLRFSISPMPGLVIMNLIA